MVARTPAPARPARAGLAAQAAATGAAVGSAAVAAHPSCGSRLWLSDIHAALTVTDLYDGIHPTREAHDKVADAWLVVLAPLLPPAF